MPRKHNRSHSSATSPTLAAPGVALSLYAALVIYGSLLPFHYTWRPLLPAWDYFRSIGLLDLGLMDRADWIANGVLFAPLGALLFAYLARRGRSWVFASLAFIFCAIFAFALEFTQLYFPPRTVSLNDVFAEVVGAAFGIVFWWLAGRRVQTWLVQTLHGGRATFTALLAIYALLYAALSLFPFDFVVTAQELARKIELSGQGWLSPSTYCRSTFACLEKLTVEVIAALPLGMLIGYMRSQRPGSLNGVVGAALAGLALGSAIEFLQYFMVSGNSHAVSAFTRAGGFAIGYLAAAWIERGYLERLYNVRRILLLVALVPYVLGLAYANKWFEGQPMSWAAARDVLGSLNYIPFYYHYFVSEASALTSALIYFALYLPIGIMIAVWPGRTPRASHTAAVGATLAGAATALCMEAGKLLLAGRVPDPTDVAIAAAAALLGWALTRRLLQPQVVQPPSAATAVETTSPLIFIGLAAAALALFAAAQYPLGGIWMTAALLTYAVVLLRYPHAWLIVVGAALPLFDLAQDTGWFFFDEFDILILVTLAVGYTRYRPTTNALHLHGRLLFSLVGLSFSIAALRGLLPLQTLDASAFSDYRSNYNALRIFKGFFWALALLPLLRQAYQEPPEADRLFALGTTLGLLGVAFLALRERMLFASVFDFSSDFRVTVLSAMHVGSGVIEGYLILAIPLAAYLGLRAPTRIERIIGWAGVVLGIHTMMVTFSRGGQLALALTLFTLVAGTLIVRPRAKPSLAFATLGVVLLLAALVGPVVLGPLMQKRFANVSEDLARRVAHWKGTIALAQGGVATQLFGHGMGAFPRAYAFGNPAAQAPANYRFMREGENGFLRLGPGEPFYMEQRVTAPPGQYRIEFEARTRSPNALLATPLCEKTVLYSRKCVWDQIALNRPPGAWQKYGNGIDIEELGDAGKFGRRPIKLALHLVRANEPIDIDNVRLIDPFGRNVVQNGDFEHGAERWFFSTDNLWPWHVENLLVHLWFEHGWIGLALFMLWFGWLLVSLARRSVRGDAYALAAFAALSGFFVVGMFSSLMDAPRLVFLFFMLALTSTLTSSTMPREKPLPR